MNRSLIILLFFGLGGHSLQAACKPFTQDGKQKMSCEVETGFLPGGKGMLWGDWHTISSPLPTGYRVESVSFRLEGPHPCSADVTYPPARPPKSELNKAAEAIVRSLHGLTDYEASPEIAVIPRGIGSWAECSEESVGPTSVEWKFHFQGWSQEKRTTEITKDEAKFRWEENPMVIKQRAVLSFVAAQMPKQ